MSRGAKPTTRRSPTQGGREVHVRLSAEEYARVKAAAEAERMTVPAYVRAVVLGGRERDDMPAVMAATEPVQLDRPLPMSTLTRFGGRRPGGSCGCGGILEQTRHENVAVPGWTLDCTTCGASYDEDGNHWCPACETWPKRWVGGTDADPRPACENCGADQPGWPARPLVMVGAVEEGRTPGTCWTCAHADRHYCMLPASDDTASDWIWQHCTGVDMMPGPNAPPCPGWAPKEPT